MASPGIYQLVNAGRITAGPGSIETLAALPREFGAERVLIITDRGVRQSGVVDRPKAILEAAGVAVAVIDDTPPEPEAGDVQGICERAAGLGCQLVVGIGGGSVMDTAKLVSVVLANHLSISQLLAKAPIGSRGLATVLVPTTAGTGSEATPNAIVLVPEEELKVGIVDAKLLPDCVILDPVMTVGLPPAVTASTGMDALTHAVECYTSKKANPFSDLYALAAIRLLTRSIRRAYADGSDVEARHDMLLGALYGGMSIATSGTTAVHALAYPLGGKYRIAHGLSNAVLLPLVMKFNLEAVPERFRDIAGAMGIDLAGLTARQAAGKMVENLEALIADLNLDAGLRARGITEQDVDALVEAAAKVTRLLDNNPRPMPKEAMREIYLKLLR